MATNKGRVLFLLNYLRDNTDVEHPVTTSDLVNLYTNHGFSGNRKTVKDDVTELNQNGFTVEATKVQGTGNITSYYYDGREFDLPELKMLIDAVSAAQFISESHRSNLIDKIAGLAGRNHSDALKSDVGPLNQLKTANRALFLVVDRIQIAISRQKKIRFQYYDYNTKKERILHNDGEYYTFSPYRCEWDGDRHYVLGRSDKRPDELSQFRTDRMCLPEILDEDSVPAPADFDLSEYSAHLFKMYRGHEEDVTLVAENDLMKSLIDRFGDGFISAPVSATEFEAKVRVAVSPVFFAWVAQFRGEVKVTAPGNVHDEYIAYLEALLDSAKR